MAGSREARGEGLTRLYRVEPVVSGGRPDWIGQAQAASGHREAEGRWFVADPALLDRYRQDAAGPTRTVFVDVPTADLERYRVANSEERMGLRPVRSFSRDPENEYFLPRALADARQVLPEAPAADRDAGIGVYQVWHDAGWPERAVLNARFGVETPFPQGFIHVADVEAAGLGHAAALAADSGAIPWEENKGVRALVSRSYTRDTDAGDVIVDPHGRAHRYDGHGFAAIESAGPSLPSPAAIAAGAGRIAVVWDVQAVLAHRPDLSEDQARAVLRQVAREHDGNRGITRETLDDASRELFPEADPFAAVWARSIGQLGIPLDGIRAAVGEIFPDLAGESAPPPGERRGSDPGRGDGRGR